MRSIADYELEESLGTGNHGEFFRARPPDRLDLDDEWVAVKVLGLHADDDAFRRLANELKLFASVPCAQLVTLHDAGQQAGSLYYATEYLAAGSLAQPAEPPTRVRVLRAMADAARAAHALHEAGVAHRDIKPGNVLLVDGDGAKLSDLGLAQILTPGQTITGIGPIGTIEFMEPQLIQDGRAGRASDVWSIGVTLHRALTGESLYGTIPDADLLTALRHVLQTDPVLAEDLTADEAELIRACLAPERSDRPPTADEVADELDRIAEESA